MKFYITLVYFVTHFSVYLFNDMQSPCFECVWYFFIISVIIFGSHPTEVMLCPSQSIVGGLPEAISSRPLQGHHLLDSHSTHSLACWLSWAPSIPLCQGNSNVSVGNLGNLWLSRGPVQWVFCCLGCLGLSEEGVEMRVPSAVPLQECLCLL